MKKPFITKIYKIALRIPGTVLLFALICTAVSLYYAKNLKIETDFSSLLPPGNESVQNLDQLTEYFGSMGYLYVTVEAENPELAKSYADQLAPRIENLPSVRYVDYRRPVEFFKKRKWLFVEEADLREMEHRVDRSLVLQEEGVSPVFSDLMDFADEEDRPDLTFKDIQKKYEEKLGGNDKEVRSGEEGKFVILRVKAKRGAEDFEANRALLVNIQEIEKQLKSQDSFKSIDVRYAGSYISSIESVDLIKKEMTTVTLVVSIALLLILLFYFKRFSGALLVGLPLAIGVLWTGGLVYLILGHVNIITAFAVSILAGLGSDYGIYLLSRFAGERDGGKGFDESCSLAFETTGKATFMAMITTVGAFGALVFSGFDLFVEFGIVGCLGLFLNYLAMMLLMPAFLKIARRHEKISWIQFLIGWKQGARRKPLFEFRWHERIFTTRGTVGVLSLVVLLIIAGSLTLPKQSKIYFEDGQLNFDNIPSNKHYDRVSKNVGSSLHPTVLLVKGHENERGIVKSFNKQLDEDKNGELVYEKVLGLSTFVPDDTQEKRDILRRLLKKYPQNRYVNQGQKDIFTKSVRETLQAPSITQKELPKEITRLFVSSKDPEVYTAFVFPAMGRKSSEQMKKYNKGILEAKAKSGNEAIPVDGSFVSMDIINLISREAPRGLVLILLFFSGVLLITLRNVKRSLLILVNLMAGLVILSGALYVGGIRLNILNISVFPIILGTGIDCFIHFSNRFDETGDLKQALGSEAPAILISSLTSMVGFGGLLLTSSVGLRSIAWVSVIGLIIITLLCVFVFPRCLALFAEKKELLNEMKNSGIDASSIPKPDLS